MPQVVLCVPLTLSVLTVLTVAARTYALPAFLFVKKQLLWSGVVRVIGTSSLIVCCALISVVRSSCKTVE